MWYQFTGLVHCMCLLLLRSVFRWTLVTFSFPLYRLLYTASVLSTCDLGLLILSICKSFFYMHVIFIVSCDYNTEGSSLHNFSLLIRASWFMPVPFWNSSLWLLATVHDNVCWCFTCVYPCTACLYNYTLCLEKVPLYFWLWLCPVLIDFPNFFFYR